MTYTRKLLPPHPVRLLAGDDLGHLPAETDAVVGAPVLGIDLGRVRQPQALDRCLERRDSLRIVDADDGLRRVFPMVEALLDPRLVELGVDLLQGRNVALPQLLG